MLETWLSSKLLPPIAAQRLGWQAEKNRIVVEWPSSNSSRVIHRFHPDRPDIQDWEHRDHALPYGINTVMVREASEVVVVFNELDYLALTVSGVPAVVYPGSWHHEWFDVMARKLRIYFWVNDMDSGKLLTGLAQSIGSKVTYGAIRALPDSHTPLSLIMRKQSLDDADLEGYVRAHRQELYYTNDFNKALKRLKSLKSHVIPAEGESDETYITPCPFHPRTRHNKALLTRTTFHCPTCGTRGSATEFFGYYQIIIPQTTIERRVAVVQTIKLSTVRPRKLEWLWASRVPAGKITILTGKPQIGKSLISLDLAARVSSGKILPGDGRARRPASVVLMTAEDDIEDTVVPRLMAAGADLDNILVISSIAGRWPLLGDVHALAKTMERNKAVLLIVDPMTAYLGSTDAYSDAQVRAYLTPLTEAAKEGDFSVLLIRHPRKAAVEDELLAGGGSIAFSALARSELHATPNTHDGSSQLRTLKVVKANLCKPPRPINYLVDVAEGNIPRILWLDKAGRTS